MQLSTTEILSHYSHSGDLNGYVVPGILVLQLIVQMCTSQEVTGPTAGERCIESTEQVVRDRYVLGTSLDYIILVKVGNGSAVQEVIVQRLLAQDSQPVHMDLRQGNTGSDAGEKHSGFMPMARVAVL